MSVSCQCSFLKVYYYRQADWTRLVDCVEKNFAPTYFTCFYRYWYQPLRIYLLIFCFFPSYGIRFYATVLDLFFPIFHGNDKIRNWTALKKFHWRLSRNLGFFFCLKEHNWNSWLYHFPTIAFGHCGGLCDRSLFYHKVLEPGGLFSDRKDLIIAVCSWQTRKTQKWRFSFLPNGMFQIFKKPLKLFC